MQYSNPSDHRNRPEDLVSRKRWIEEAQAYLCYTDSVDEAATSLVSGNELSKAIRIVRTIQKGVPLWLMRYLLASGKDLIDNAII